MLAWIRTGIALMGFGFVVSRFGLFLRGLGRVSGHPVTQRFDSALIGTLVVGAGVAVNVWASVRHRRIARRMSEDRAEISQAGPIVVGLASGVGGVLLIGAMLRALSP